MPELNGNVHTWEEFSRLNSVEVSTRSGVPYDTNLNLFTLRSFGHDIFISLNRREVFSDSKEGEFLLGLKEFFFDLCVLWYLISTSKTPLSGELIKPANLPGGQIFIQGTHVLPMDAIAQKFNNRKQEFLGAGSQFGGVETELGDVGLELHPFPRVPVYLVLWFGDEDFPPQGQLLLDSSCSNHLSTDVIWAMTMVCCLIFLRDIKDLKRA